MPQTLFISTIELLQALNYILDSAGATIKIVNIEREHFISTTEKNIIKIKELVNNGFLISSSVNIDEETEISFTVDQKLMTLKLLKECRKKKII